MKKACSISYATISHLTCRNILGEIAEIGPPERQVSPGKLLDDHAGKKQKNLAKNWPYKIEVHLFTKFVVGG